MSTAQLSYSTRGSAASTTTRTTTIMSDPDKRRAELDGVSHINIDARGRTELGRALSHMHHQQFIHPEFGPFQSIEGFIGFLRSGATNDEFHYLFGMNARYRSRKLELNFISGFREIVMEANYLKIVQNAELHELFIQSNLPFEHYYLHGESERPIRPKNAGWIIPRFEELRTCMKAGQAWPKADYRGVADIGHATSDD